MRTTTLLPGCLLLLSLTAPALLLGQADSTTSGVDSAKVEAIRRYLELTKTADMFLLGFEQAMEAQADAPGTPDGFIEAFRAKVHERTSEFIDLLVPLYDRHLSLADLSTMIEFYRTPLGQRMVDLQVDLTTQAPTVAERWAMALVGEVFMDLARKPKS